MIDLYPAATPNGRKKHSIADMALFSWCRLACRERVEIKDSPNVKRWFDAIAARPAAAKHMAPLEDIVNGFSPASWDVSFGARQRARPEPVNRVAPSAMAGLGRFPPPRAATRTGGTT